MWSQEEFLDSIPRHQCLIYEQSTSAHLLDLARTIIINLRENRRCLYINSPDMVDGMRRYLGAEGLDLPAEIEKGSLNLTSDQNHLLNGLFDVEQMLEMLKSYMQNALADGYAGFWVSGDITWEFAGQCDFDKLDEYEQKLDEFIRQNAAFSTVCQYHRKTLPLRAAKLALRNHQASYINDTLSRVNALYKSKIA